MLGSERQTSGNSRSLDTAKEENRIPSTYPCEKESNELG
jgi:hypothetical protein